jgi:hypothetical protein
MVMMMMMTTTTMTMMMMMMIGRNGHLIALTPQTILV